MRNINNIKKIIVFDLDGSLIDSGTPDRFKPIYKEKTGNEWPHKGWWGQRLSLDLNIFPIKPIDFTVNHYHRVKDEENVLTILMTGRIKPLEKEVRAILDTFNFKFDHVLLNPTHDTLKFKLNELDGMIKIYENLECIEFIDDRLSHMDSFIEWGKNQEEQKENFKFIYHLVPSDEII